MNLFPWKKKPESVRRYFKRRARLLITEPRETDSVAPITAVGGVPWWPSGLARPRCHTGHPMGFLAQVLLADVPGLESDAGKLLSFHYCHQCMYDGKMSFGWEEEGDAESEEPKGYDVRVLDVAGSTADGKGLADDDVNGAFSVQFDDYDDLMVFTETYLKSDPVWSARIEDGLARNVIQEISGAEAKAFRWYTGEPGPDQESGAEHVFWNWPGEFEDGCQTKIGGWPNWDQDEAWPSFLTKESPLLVLQLDWRLASNTACGGGGKMYLFVNPPDSATRIGVFVLQNT